MLCIEQSRRNQAEEKGELQCTFQRERMQDVSLLERGATGESEGCAGLGARASPQVCGSAPCRHPGGQGITVSVMLL